jgi:hypothetical protein
MMVNEAHDRIVWVNHGLGDWRCTHGLLLLGIHPSTVPDEARRRMEKRLTNKISGRRSAGLIG